MRHLSDAIFSKRVVPRGLGFIFDQIIAHALLGASKSMYPGSLQTASKFSNKGYTLDSPTIAKEACALLYSGAVRITRSDVCQGERETLSFSAALQIRLYHALSAGTQTIIRDYMIALADLRLETSSASSGSTLDSITSAGPGQLRPLPPSRTGRITLPSTACTNSEAKAAGSILDAAKQVCRRTRSPL